mmetsp:Transcript_11075/g.37705  ORF Transcript_11075/g.37705 Transcript_11075/m.37705 type:complete len:287 (-) Transcript_11075:98-958(-)
MITVRRVRAGAVLLEGRAEALHPARRRRRGHRRRGRHGLLGRRLLLGQLHVGRRLALHERRARRHLGRGRRGRLGSGHLRGVLGGGLGPHVDFGGEERHDGVRARGVVARHLEPEAAALLHRRQPAHGEPGKLGKAAAHDHLQLAEEELRHVVVRLKGAHGAAHLGRRQALGGHRIREADGERRHGPPVAELARGRHHKREHVRRSVVHRRRRHAARRLGLREVARLGTAAQDVHELGPDVGKLGAQLLHLALHREHIVAGGLEARLAHHLLHELAHFLLLAHRHF